MLIAQADERADHRDLVHEPGDSRQMLADLDPRQPRGDGLELTADAVGRFEFEVEGVLVRQTPRQVDHNHRLVARTRDFS